MKRMNTGLLTILITMTFQVTSTAAEKIGKYFSVRSNQTGETVMVTENDKGQWVVVPTSKMGFISYKIGLKADEILSKSHFTKEVPSYKDVSKGEYIKGLDGSSYKVLEVYPDGSLVVRSAYSGGGEEIKGHYKDVLVTETDDCPEKGRAYLATGTKVDKEWIETVQAIKGTARLGIYNNGPFSKAKNAIAVACLSNGQVVLEYFTNAGYMGASITHHGAVLDRGNDRSWQAVDDFTVEADGKITYQAGRAHNARKAAVLKQASAGNWRPTGPIKGSGKSAVLGATGEEAWRPTGGIK